MNININSYIPLCNAIVLLMKPLVEVVIHDLESNTICFIAGGLSQRQVGDPSMIDTSIELMDKELETIVYPKSNFDGRLVRSISVPLKEEGQMKALLCINCDISVFNQMQILSEQILALHPENQPQMLFKNDWQERLHIAIHKIIQQKEWDFKQLTSGQKKELVHTMYKSGVFSEKKSADYTAQLLGMGRATIFKYLKEWRKSNE